MSNITEIVTTVSDDIQEIHIYCQRLSRLLAIFSLANFGDLSSYSTYEINNLEWHEALPTPSIGMTLRMAFSHKYNVRAIFYDVTAIPENRHDLCLQIDNLVFSAHYPKLDNIKRNSDSEDNVILDNALDSLFTQYFTYQHRGDMLTVDPFSDEDYENEIIEFIEDYRDWGFYDKDYNNH